MLRYNAATVVLAGIIVIVAGALTYTKALSGEAFTALTGAILGYVFRKEQTDGFYYSNAPVNRSDPDTIRANG